MAEVAVGRFDIAGDPSPHVDRARTEIDQGRECGHTSNTPAAYYQGTPTERYFA